MVKTMDERLSAIAGLPLHDQKQQLVDHGAVWVSDEDWVTLTLDKGFYYHICCECGASHRVHVFDPPSEITLKFVGLDEVPLDDISPDKAVIDARGE